MIIKYLLAAVAAYGQSAWLVKDVVDAVPGSSSPRSAVQVGNAVYFAASSPNGNLYKYDIATRRVSLVREFSDISNLFAINNRVVFTATGGNQWVSDGTATGTTMIAGPGISFYQFDLEANLSVVSGGYLYFACSGPATGNLFPYGLCRTDGTPAGTSVFLANTEISSLAELNGEVYFTARNLSGSNHALWATDGTTGGTRQIAGLAEGLQGAYLLKRFGNALYFRGFLTGAGWELWKSDGTTAGTAMLVDINPGIPGGNFHPLAGLGNALLFFSDTPSGGCGLFKTDGTAGGTVLISPINSGSPISCQQSYLRQYVTVNGLLLYHTYSQPQGGTFLYRTDGTTAGTFMISQSRDRGFSVLGSTVVFNGYNGNGYELWKTDGTIGGTGLLKDFCPLSCDGDPVLLAGMSNGKGLMAAVTAENGRELWDTDGTTAGTALVADINVVDAGSQPTGAIAYGGAYYYLTFTGTGVVQLWRTLGTEATTILIATTGVFVGTPTLYTAGGYLVFVSADGKLWRSDGTGPGTLNYQSLGVNLRLPAMAAGGKLYFTRLSGNQLYVTDGTAAGTASLGIEVPGAMNATVGAELPDGRLIFTGIRRSPAYSEEPWVTDGTGPNTFMLAQLVVNGISQPRNYVRAASYVFFTSNFGLGRSDGTAGGTLALGGNGVLSGPFFSIGNEAFYHCVPGNSMCKSGPSPSSSVLLRGDVYPTANVTGRGWDVAYLPGKAVFRGVSSANGDVEPWITDGTAGGTFYLRDIVAGGSPSLSGDPLNFLSTGAALFFSAQSEDTSTTTDRELWVTDGTSPGTNRVADIFPGKRVLATSTVNRASNPVPMIALPDGRALLSADSPLRGRELWMAHPTACTVPLDVTPQLTITAGVPVFNRNSGRFVQQVTVRNNGAAVDGVAYVLGGLNAAVTPLNTHGVAHCASPVGSPYRDIGAIGAGQTITVTLEMTAAAGTPLSYTPKVVAAVDGPR